MPSNGNVKFNKNLDYANDLSALNKNFSEMEQILKFLGVQE